MKTRIVQGGADSTPPQPESHPVAEVAAGTGQGPVTLRVGRIARDQFRAAQVLLRRHSLAAFVALSYALTWCMLPVGTYVAAGPLVAAVIVVAATEGRPGLRRLAGHALRWRVRWVWYAAAVGIPLAVHLVTVAGNAAVGGPPPSSGALTPWYALATVFALRLMNPLDGPLGEEPAWRGYAQPRLQARRSPLISTGILCLLVTGWHLPLYFLPAFGLRPFEAVSTIACTVVYAWLFNRSGGSALITLLAHVTEGTVRTGGLWPAEVDATRAKAVYAVAWAGVAVILLVADHRAWITAPVSATWPDPADADDMDEVAGERPALLAGRPHAS
jgi:membrane protease YdiL (CAAX protease family)